MTQNGNQITLNLEEAEDLWNRGAWWMHPLPGKNPPDFATYLQSKGIDLSGKEEKGDIFLKWLDEGIAHLKAAQEQCVKEREYEEANFHHAGEAIVKDVRAKYLSLKSNA